MQLFWNITGFLPFDYERRNPIIVIDRILLGVTHTQSLEKWKFTFLCLKKARTAKVNRLIRREWKDMKKERFTLDALEEEVWSDKVTGKSNKFQNRQKTESS